MSSFEKYFLNGKEISQNEAEKHLNKSQQNVIFKDIAHSWFGKEEFKTDIGTIIVHIPKL